MDFASRRRSDVSLKEGGELMEKILGDFEVPASVLPDQLENPMWLHVNE